MKIISIKKITPRIVYAISTTSETFISDGLAHHNCTHCNHFGRGMLNIYAEKLIKMYGPNIVEELNALKWKKDEWTKDDLINIIEDMKERINKLQS